jgi:hypothetical protein
MKKEDFKIKEKFLCADNVWMCADIGTRVIIAIKLDHPEDPSWYTGPEYALEELVFTEFDFPVCYKITIDPQI